MACRVGVMVPAGGTLPDFGGDANKRAGMAHSGPGRCVLKSSRVATVTELMRGHSPASKAPFEATMEGPQTRGSITRLNATREPACNARRHFCTRFTLKNALLLLHKHTRTSDAGTEN